MLNRIVVAKTSCDCDATLIMRGLFPECDVDRVKEENNYIGMSGEV